jgi:hypothetical protein
MPVESKRDLIALLQHEEVTLAVDAATDLIAPGARVLAIDFDEAQHGAASFTAAGFDDAVAHAVRAPIRKSGRDSFVEFKALLITALNTVAQSTQGVLSRPR